MTKLLLDQGLPRTTVSKLKAVGWDTVHTQDVGLERASDSGILEYARDQGRSVITLDADFHALLAVKNELSPSVVRIRQEGLTGSELANLLLHIWPRIERSISAGAMVTITRTAVRIRHLPILKTTPDA